MSQSITANSGSKSGLLGDTTDRDYSDKLLRFNAFAEKELRQAINWLDVRRGMRVVDAGCGTGNVLCWFAECVGLEGTAIGMDIASAHIAAAKKSIPANGALLQADICQPPLRTGSVDVLWALNVVNHLTDPVVTLQVLRSLLQTSGRIAIAQSSFLADMYFAWDSRLEEQVTRAVRRYYRDRYRLSDVDLTGIRATAGLLRRAGFSDLRTRTFVIERLSPLRPVDEDYLLNTIFRGTWGERLRPYLEAEDFAVLCRLCDPESHDYALRRSDFHFLQTLTVVTASA